MSVKFENVSYIYQAGSPFASSALKNINLEIHEHDFLALIGHTGSGKSTLGQLINSLLKPTEGIIYAGDFVIDAKQKKVKNLKMLKKYAGLVFQFPEYQLFEDTVLKDVSFGPKNFGISEEDAVKIAKEALKEVNISEDLFDKSPFELSGGQKRRVAIAGIIALEPKFLILDEPTAGLDPQGSLDMMNLFKKIHEKGTTIIMISHDMDNVLGYANRVVVMAKGEIIEDTKPEELFLKDNLLEKYNIARPDCLKFALSLKEKGFNIDVNKIKNIDTLIEQIKEGHHG